MKRIFYFIMLISATSWGQAKEKINEPSQSKTEIFTEKSGTLMKKEFVEVGYIGKCKIEVAHFTDLITDEKINAVRFEYTYSSTYTSDTKTALLDADEIEGLIKSLNIIRGKIITTIATNYTEVIFKGRSGFSAGCYSKKEKWELFLKLERFDSNSYVFFKESDFADLLSLLASAKSKL